MAQNTQTTHSPPNKFAILWRSSWAFKIGLVACALIIISAVSFWAVNSLTTQQPNLPETPATSTNNPLQPPTGFSTPDESQSDSQPPAATTPGTSPKSTTGSSGNSSTGNSSGSNNNSGGGGSNGPSCAAGTHVVGGSDATGGCWPGPNNTGIPAGTVLSAYGGPCTITTDNTVIDGKTVNCDMSIQASNVTIKNSKVNGSLIVDLDLPGSSSWSLTLVDSEVDGGQQQISAVGWGNLTVLRANIHGGQAAIQCEENSSSCYIQDSYLHGQYIPDDQPWHLGGFLSDGGQNMTFKHNFIICDHAVNSVNEGCTGDLNLIPNFASITNVLIEHNLFGANIGSSYCTYGGEKSTSPTPHSDHIIYKDNIFQRGTNNLCAAFGPVTNFDINQPGNQWINNRWADGGVVDPAN